MKINQFSREKYRIKARDIRKRSHWTGGPGSRTIPHRFIASFQVTCLDKGISSLQLALS